MAAKFEAKLNEPTPCCGCPQRSLRPPDGIPEPDCHCYCHDTPRLWWAPAGDK